MYNGIIFDIPTDGVRDNDNILIELMKDCDISCAQNLFNTFQKIYPKATITILHPDMIKSIHFFHKADDDSPTLPF